MAAIEEFKNEIRYAIDGKFYTVDEVRELLISASDLCGHTPMELYSIWGLENKICTI